MQRILVDLSRVRANQQAMAADYKGSAQTHKDALDDIAAARGPLGKCLLDDTIKVVSADGATVKKEINECIIRLRGHENRLQGLVIKSDNVHFPLPGLDQELAQLAVSMAGQPEVAALLNQVRELVQISSSQHQGAGRAAGWTRGKAMLGEFELTQCGNSLNVLPTDAPGKSIAADAGPVKFRVDNGDVHLKPGYEHIKSSVTYENNAVLALQDAEARLGKAIALFPPEDTLIFTDSAKQPEPAPPPPEGETALDIAIK